MPPTAEDRLLDIIEAIAEIDKMLSGYRLEQFTEDKNASDGDRALSRSHLRGGAKAS
jgi:hypothetical protein